MEHDALHILTRSGEPMRWALTCGEARWEGIPPARATANSQWANLPIGEPILAIVRRRPAPQH
jgi:hypothetical protein